MFCKEACLGADGDVRGVGAVPARVTQVKQTLRSNCSMMSNQPENEDINCPRGRVVGFGVDTPKLPDAEVRSYPMSSMCGPHPNAQGMWPWSQTAIRTSEGWGAEKMCAACSLHQDSSVTGDVLFRSLSRA